MLANRIGIARAGGRGSRRTVGGLLANVSGRPSRSGRPGDLDLEEFEPDFEVEDRPVQILLPVRRVRRNQDDIAGRDLAGCSRL